MAFCFSGVWIFQKFSHKTNKPNKEKNIQQPSLKQKSTQPTKRPLTKKRENGRPKTSYKSSMNVADRRCRTVEEVENTLKDSASKGQKSLGFCSTSGWNSEDADIRKQGGFFSWIPWKVTNYFANLSTLKNIYIYIYGLEDLVFLLGMSVGF